MRVYYYIFFRFHQFFKHWLPDYMGDNARPAIFVLTIVEIFYANLAVCYAFEPSRFVLAVALIVFGVINWIIFINYTIPSSSFGAFEKKEDKFWILLDALTLTIIILSVVLNIPCIRQLEGQ